MANPRTSTNGRKHSGGPRSVGDVIDGTMNGEIARAGRNPDEVPETKAAGEPENKYKTVPRPTKAIKDRLAGYAREFDEIDEHRAELNAKHALLREKVKNEGVDVAMFMCSRRIAKRDEHERETIDLSYKLAREALGKPIQQDWVDLTPSTTKQ